MTRTCLLTIRLTPEELATLRAQAAASGQTVADLVRLAVRLLPRRPEPSSTDTDG